MKFWGSILFLINIALISFSANSYILFEVNKGIILACIVSAVIANLIPSFTIFKKMSFRLRMCWHGTSSLQVFRVSLVISIVFHICLAFQLFPDQWLDWVWSALVCFVIEAILFWNGMISLYLTSTQLGIKQRVIGALCGMIPIVNLIVLDKMLRITKDEVYYELKREELDRSRADQKLCTTKYPILLVHGVFFRDFKHFNYWGRIPAALIKNGAQIYYGDHHSAASVAECAQELTDRIKHIVEENGCEKLNVIAHSKGGLDMRYAMQFCGAAPYVASLVTINTPHRGCKFADYLLNKAPDSLRNKIADTYNSAFKKLGDEHPDFLKAVRDLTSEKCVERDKNMAVPGEVFTYSYGSKLGKAAGGTFPLNLTYHLVNIFDGANDGLVGEDSFAWGSGCEILEPKEDRGISHADMIDLTRENIPGFDVREFYVELVSRLRNMGL